ncbi:MAG: NifB/NifX family molybdenum-iron cluster-binding protein [Dehalococcoidia bacterium]
MKLAITATGQDLDADLDPRFGRCNFFIFIDPDTMDFVAVSNNASAGGAGIAAGQMVVKYGAKVVLTGDCGPNAFQVLSAADVDVYTGVSGKVKDVINNFKAGKYKTISKPSVRTHHGQAA